MVTRRVVLFLITILLTLGCTPKETNYSELGRSLDEYFASQFPSDQPGGAILVAKGDTVIYVGCFGVADLVGRRIHPGTLFNLGSISKTFVSNAILILQEEGKLSLEDSLYRYFPEFKNKEIAQRVRIKHLLSHTSGLPDNREVSKDSIYYLTAKDEENWSPIMNTDSLLFEPGERFEYSNPAYNGLALIVEKVSGMKWQKFVELRILKPSGMVYTTITDGPHPESGVSHGYIKIGEEWKEDDYGEEPTFAAAGNGGVWSSVTELLLYEQALRNATFLKKETIAQSRAVFIPSNWSDSIAPNVGWSWFMGKTSDGMATVGHTGSQGGFLCNYLVIPEKRIQIVILCNTPRDVEGFTRKILNVLMAEFLAFTRLSF